MGLIKAAKSAFQGNLSDQWKEFFTCNSLPADVLVKKGTKMVTKRSENVRASDDVITDGSGIVVAPGQCVIIAEMGKIVELCAEPGEYTYKTDLEPSVFSGSLGSSVVESFKNMVRRVGFGGDPARDQRVYYFNTKEIMDNKFGTPNPFMFDVVNKNIGMSRTVQIRCNGIYSYKITDPVLFYSEVCGNVEHEFTRDDIDSQLKTEFIDALQPAFAALSELQLRPAQIPGHAGALKDAMNNTLKNAWAEKRGIMIQTIALNPITLTEEDMRVINKMEDAATMGSNPFIMAGRMTESTAQALENAASNEGGAMMGFMGLGMAQQAGGLNIQNLYSMGQQQKMQQEQAQHAAEDKAAEWTCACGTANAGKFCTECGAKKPEKAEWTCSCGTVNSGKFCTECGAKRPETAEWTCSCGTVNSGKFCTECGAKRP